MLIGGGLVYAFTSSLLITGVGAVVLGAVVYAGIAVVDRASYRARMLDGTNVQNGVLIKCYWIQDDSEDRHHVIVVERGRTQHRLSHTNLDRLLADVALVAERLQAGENIPMTVSERGAQDRLEDGLVDGKSEHRLREEIRKTLKVAFGTEREATIQNLRDRCGEYHDPLWHHEIEHRLKTGIISVRRSDGGQLWEDNEATLSLTRDFASPRNSRPDGSSLTPV